MILCNTLCVIAVYSMQVEESTESRISLLLNLDFWISQKQKYGAPPFYIGWVLGLCVLKSLLLHLTQCVPEH